jgi:hypothetical protein
MVNLFGPRALSFWHVPKRSLDLLLSELCVKSRQVDGRPLEDVPVEVEVAIGRRPYGILKVRLSKVALSSWVVAQPLSALSFVMKFLRRLELALRWKNLLLASPMFR